ncbi:MAG TPA: anti-sigma factor [Candidatus Limnocylindrales bacterium]|nr:anti-sigma factor [Candidatus Limnocylindrales bacterium]
MSHCDETTLALAALGEDIPADEAAHLHSCSLCTTDLAELIEVVTLGREAPAELPEVPDRVWAGIRRELSLAGAPDGSDSGSGLRHLSAPRTSVADADAHVADNNVVRLDRRRSRGPLWGVAAVAAAAGALVGGAVVWSAVERGSSGAGSSEQFVAQAVLAPLSETVTAPGEATVLDSADGEVVRVDARSLPANDGFYEVWLLDADATKLIALGALPAGSIGTFTIPPGLSIDDYPVVDISLESYDGDPSHSKNSLMRGELQA